jgi:hypothetical protein
MPSIKQTLLLGVLISWHTVGTSVGARESAPAVQQTPDAVMVYPVGTASCSIWLDSRAEPLAKDIRAVQMKAFLYGYATAINVTAIPKEPALGTLEAAGIDAFLDDYCTQHPTSIFLRAVQALVEEIHPNWPK